MSKYTKKRKKYGRTEYYNSSTRQWVSESILTTEDLRDCSSLICSSYSSTDSSSSSSSYDSSCGGDF